MARKPHDGSSDNEPKGKRRGPKQADVEPGDEQESERASSGDGSNTAPSSRTFHGLRHSQRLFAQAYVADPERRVWRAAWKAGLCSSLPDVEDEPEPGSQRRKNLASAGSRTAAMPKVREYIAHLEQQAIGEWISTPEGSSIVGDLSLDRERELDATALAAKNLAIMVAMAHRDPREVVSWTQDEIIIADSSQLDYYDALLIREVTHETTYSANGDQVCTTKVKLAPREPWAQMLEKRLGKQAPQKLEVSGPDGKPIETRTEHSLTPSSEQIDEMAYMVLGVVPATSTRQEVGIPLEEIRAVIEKWELDSEPHVMSSAELFAPENWEETERRYLVGDGAVED